MLRMRTICLFIILVVSCISCKKEVRLDELQSVTLSFNSLPNEVKQVYLQEVLPDTINGYIIHDTRSEPYDLDSISSTITYEYTGKSGVRPGYNVFGIGDCNFTKFWDANKTSAPYVFHKKKLYMAVRNSMHGEKGVKKGEYRCYDLKQYLNY